VATDFAVFLRRFLTEANRRIHDLMNGTQHEPWRLLMLNLTV
jgi:hypothetical protein